MCSCTARAARSGVGALERRPAAKAASTASSSASPGAGRSRLRRDSSELGRVELGLEVGDQVAQQLGATSSAAQRELVERRLGDGTVDEVVQVGVFDAKLDQPPIRRVQIAVFHRFVLLRRAAAVAKRLSLMPHEQHGLLARAATGMHRGDRAYQQDQVRIIGHARVRGCALAVVADGMGGKSGGRKAADQVVLTAQQLFDRFVPGVDDRALLLQQIVMEAHLMIRLTAITAEESRTAHWPPT